MISETRQRLKEWGRWGSGGTATVGNMWRSLFGRQSSNSSGEMPKAVQEIDTIVCRAEVQDRAILIKYYCSPGRLSEKARELGVSRWTFRRRLQEAEYYVNSVLDGVAPNEVHNRQYAVSARTIPQI